jgi:pyruvate dehydrogenase E2 component (dihydrolipoamide acetyltransferase)
MINAMESTENKVAYQVVMPRLGLTMTEAKILDWLKPEGSWVEKGEVLFVIENEKATLDIEAPASGYLRIQAPGGTTVPILQPVALLDGGGEFSDVNQAATLKTKTVSRKGITTAVMPAVTNSADRNQISASPRARVEAHKLGVDLTELIGSGMRGMVVLEDVRKVAATRPTVHASPVARRLAAHAGVDLQQMSGSGPRGQVMRGDVEKQMTGGVKTALPLEIRSLGGLRGVIAERLTQGWRERPQVTLTTDADASNLVAARQQLNTELADRGIKISLNALLVKIAARALQEFPYMNVRLTQQGLQVLPEINVGIAVDTDRGLLVPVVREASQKSLFELNTQLHTLVDRALKGSSLPDDLNGGTFTITNLGMYEIDAFTPIINPPECAILGVGRIITKPVGVDGQIVLRDQMALSLSFDHRLVDGAPAARFLQRIKQLIERPMVLLTNWKDSIV